MYCSDELPELQKQSEFCILEVRDVKGELTTSCQCKVTVKDGAFMQRVMKPESIPGY